MMIRGAGARGGINTAKKFLSMGERERATKDLLVIWNWPIFMYIITSFFLGPAIWVTVSQEHNAAGISIMAVLYGFSIVFF